MEISHVARLPASLQKDVVAQDACKEGEQRWGWEYRDISSLWHLLPRPLLLEVVKAARVVRSPRRQLIKGLIDKVAASMHT